MHGLGGSKDALVITYVYPGYNACYALKGETAADAMSSILDFVGDRVIQRIYSDNFGELPVPPRSLASHVRRAGLADLRVTPRPEG